MGRRSSGQVQHDGTGQADEAPSRGERKRAAAAAQQLGERLIGLPDAELARLPLPEQLRDAVRAARSIRSHGALARQRQYIGRLMRDVDPEPLLDLLEARARVQALDAGRFREVEAWRDRLVAEGDAALTALAEERALRPEQQAKLAQVLQRARHRGGSETRRAAAARELFGTLRSLFAARASGH